MFIKPKFLKPSEEGGWEEDRSDLEANNSTTFIYNPNLSLLLEQQRQRLPIFKNREHILFLLEKYQTLVLIGETGSGKSTQVPQYLMETGWCSEGRMIGITEPRRIAATSLAARVAEEKSSLLGEMVGYTIRFDDSTEKDKTKIKYMTEGILMREMMSDPLLRAYSAIMLDEVHERTINTDILMGLMKKILRKRKSLKLIVSSATVNAEELRDFFNLNSSKDHTKDTATIMSVQGRLYPVEIFYLQEPCADYVKSTVETVIKIHKNEPPGDILAFLTGQEEVDRAVKLLAQYSPQNQEMKLFVLPMYGSLMNSEIIKVFRPTPKGLRKVIIATNIAETSVTLPEIVYVIDCGFAKLKWFDCESQTESLIVVPISKASAEQRAGRSGRVRHGKTYRLYTEESWNGLEDETPSEMERGELGGGVLTLKALGINEIVRFPLPGGGPPPASLASALATLHALGALNSDSSLTDPLGKLMAELPLPPRHSKTLLASKEFECSVEIVSILALLQVKSVFVEQNVGMGAIKARIAHRKFQVEEGDLLTALNAFTAFMKIEGKLERSRWCINNFLNRKALLRAEKLRDQIYSLLPKLDIPIVSSERTENISKCLVSGFFPNAAYLSSTGVYKSIRGNRDLRVHPSSVLYTLKQPQWVIFCETVQTTCLYMRDLTTVNPTWLHELAPHFYHMTVER